MEINMENNLAANLQLEEEQLGGVKAHVGQSKGGNNPLLSQLCVEVGVEIGVLRLTISDLIDLLPDQTFEFEFDSERLVSLTAGEEVIAQGRFVTENERLLLQIESVA
jgi:flagellar motor switch/type III secretory pathway protein FliN